MLLKSWNIGTDYGLGKVSVCVPTPCRMRTGGVYVSEKGLAE